ncbi:ATP-dependent 6-phosphofructokinase [Rhodospirillum rubrum]|uniref:ATP-dependent 6-phosphofructokinase n=1 Tax=Rhodospirillum rubrum (strain ATCC 11170 / ATH 1.1.1 / DSM 467 / LMG 4362 / NCIMB 8255 / S1) TaxID=269796 RepID=Q2RVJ7_RHORT|nr:ATP-dependent 6-phosphofructokinase [Rhodospirillum rubrum]ABC21848.1 6-phosphofructokinase [Rhodospirillum rubrum ATCC 11170]AEO47549.1 6-phosphofructokinase [Rhodospirillum rubrum F11]MBK5953411.1 6-phosphofructokinase [Rhodospirillum rubrum]QXG81509.1 ATP-dependent 6-phosphofructokinase [Rhodospirillum rubrum]HAQ01296.1 6-phosphofructokinase [Rhodospirillum rubrum]
MAEIRRIGVLTSGGDCAGLNAVIRAVTHRARRAYGWKVFGILDGTMGLMDRPLRYRELDSEMFSGFDILRAGGTVLGTVNKGDPFAFPMADGSKTDRSLDFVDGFHSLELDALVVVGGDGSMRILKKLCDKGSIGMVGVPKTIDNDVHGTEYAVGFSTATNVVTEALDRLQATAASHHRVMILEVMGRDAGHIAVSAGIAGGADVILIPEIPYTLEGVAKRIREVQQEGRSHALIVVAEGVLTPEGERATVAYAGGQTRYGGISQYLSDRIAQDTGTETRVTILGHVQRGGIPSMRDRLLASAFGVHAVDLVAARKFGRMVAWQDRGVVDVPLEEVCIGPRSLDPNGTLVHAARGLGIYVGEIGAA